MEEKVNSEIKASSLERLWSFLEKIREELKFTNVKVSEIDTSVKILDTKLTSFGEFKYETNCTLKGREGKGGLISQVNNNNNQLKMQWTIIGFILVGIIGLLIRLITK